MRPAPARRSAPAPTPPASARATVEEGPQEQRLDQVVIEIRAAVQDKARPLQIETYRLPVGTAWPTVRDHYGASLNWSRDTRLADRLRGAEARAWRNGDRVFAVALIDRPVPGADGPVEPLLVVAHAD